MTDKVDKIHASGCDVEYNKACTCSVTSELKKKILDKIHLAVRTEFFDIHRKNMEFLADDLEALITQQQHLLLDRVLEEVIGEDIIDDIQMHHRQGKSKQRQAIQTIKEGL